MTTTAIIDPTQLAFSAEKTELIKRTLMPTATNDELELFLGQCQRTGLDPLARQIYAVKRWDNTKECMSWAFQVSIDGQRLIADRSGKYQGQTPAEFCGADGVWTEVWLESGPPKAARVGVYREGFQGPCYVVAHWDSYAQYTQSGELFSNWSRMGDIMIAKCAESAALRKAFPQDLSGVYTEDEMPQTNQVDRQQRTISTFADRPAIAERVAVDWPAPATQATAAPVPKGEVRPQPPEVAPPPAPSRPPAAQPGALLQRLSAESNVQTAAADPEARISETTRRGIMRACKARADVIDMTPSYVEMTLLERLKRDGLGDIHPSQLPEAREAVRKIARPAQADSSPGA